jgi:hypothetical protein
VYVGIVDSLSAGYRFLTRHLALILLPVLADLFLWWAPQLSVAPLFERLAQFYTNAATTTEMPPDMTVMAQQVAAVLNGAGQGSNLLNLLLWISNSLLHLPSLLYVVAPPRSVAAQELVGLGRAVGLGALFTLVGVGLGVTYLTLLARQLPLGAASKSWAWGELPWLVVRQWLRVTAFLLLLCVVLLAIFVPVSIGIAVLSFVSSGLTTVLAFLFVGLIMVLLLYLYFVPAGLILDDLRVPSAIVQSFRLVRDNFWSTLGLILLSELISLGFGTVLARLVAYQPLGTLLAVIANAFIGSGLALGFLIFYRSRVLLAEGQQLNVEL